jgi:hypothetical protein
MCFIAQDNSVKMVGLLVEILILGPPLLKHVNMNFVHSSANFNVVFLAVTYLL